MSFHRRAWNAAADEYGRRRAESYGRWMRAGTAIAWLGAALLLLAAVVASQGGLGG